MSNLYARTVASSALIAAALIGSTDNAQAEPAGCAPGFSDPGLVTTSERFLDAPRHAAGLAAGRYTEADLLARYTFIDDDGDGRVCLKAVSNLQGNSAANWGFFYLADDA